MRNMQLPIRYQDRRGPVFRASTVAHHVSAGGLPDSVGSKSKLEDTNVPLQLPIFVLQPSLPSAEEEFKVFEPRYRLMLQHCLEQRGPSGEFGEFGMCWPISKEKFSDVGTLLHIENHAQLPDGRSTIQCIATRRFRVLHSVKRRGLELSTNSEVEYNLATIEWFDDYAEDVSKRAFSSARGDRPRGTNARLQLVHLHDILLRAYPSPMAKILLLAIHGPTVFTGITKQLDSSKSLNVEIKTPGDDVSFVWWVLSTVLSTVVALPPPVKAALVRSVSPEARLASAGQLLDRITTLAEKFAPVDGGVELVDVAFEDEVLKDDASNENEEPIGADREPPGKVTTVEWPRRGR